MRFDEMCQCGHDEAFHYQVASMDAAVGGVYYRNRCSGYSNRRSGYFGDTAFQCECGQFRQRPYLIEEVPW